MLLILSLLLYGGLLFYSQQKNKVLSGVEQQIKDLDSIRESETEDAMIKTDEKINLSENIFKNHLYWSQLFSKIEGLTLPQIYFPETKISFTDNKVNIVFSGRAASYTALAQQMVSFKEEANTESVDVSGIKLNEEGKIEFYLNIIFSQKIIQNTVQ